MSLPISEQFDALVSLIKEVKPGLIDVSIKADDSLVEHLGLDSLDILQLSRKVTTRIGNFDRDSWLEGAGTVQSILDQINGNQAACVSPTH
jgi:acyl carrier protein